MTYCLIVDDSKVVRKVARKIIEDVGFEANEAEDGQDALGKCLTRMPDVIMLDWNMPVMDGLEFLKALRQKPDGTRPKVIFCTTENAFSNIQQAMLAGADEYIMKPFDADIVKGKLAQLGMLEP